MLYEICFGCMLLALHILYVSSHEEQKLQTCYHQCMQCGVLYDCKKKGNSNTKCMQPFYNGAKCSVCRDFNYQIFYRINRSS